MANPVDIPAPEGTADGYAGGGLEPVAEEVVPPAKPRKINLELALKGSLTKAELGDYDKLSAEEVYDKAQRLKTLHLEWQNIVEVGMNLEPFESCEHVYLQYNRIETIEGLDGMSKLQFLALQHNRIESIENLRHFKHLEFLDLSGNLITDLDVAELPISICILNLKDNPCTSEPGYQERIRAHLPDLVYLDGVSLCEDDSAGDGGLGSEQPLGGPTQELPVNSLDTGLGAYYRKDELQVGLTASIEQQIQAYSTESLADCDGFTRHIDAAVKRSERRRDNIEEQINAVKDEMARKSEMTEKEQISDLEEKLARSDARAALLKKQAAEVTAAAARARESEIASKTAK